jgi:putative membrane protein
MRLARDEVVRIDTGRMRLFAAISMVQAALIVLMVFAATAMARGLAF